MEFIIQPYQKGQEIEISCLIKKVYDAYVAPDYTDKGNQFFYDWIAPEKIAERQIDKINLHVAITNNQIVGMIEIRDNCNITLLFVDKNHHGKGIARSLFKAALEVCLTRDGQLDRFFVHASPFSIPAYERLGFIATAEMQEEHGIKYLPMEMELKMFRISNLKFPPHKHRRRFAKMLFKAFAEITRIGKARHIRCFRHIVLTAL